MPSAVGCDLIDLGYYDRYAPPCPGLPIGLPCGGDALADPLL